VISGQDFDPFGITAALSPGRDERVHGPDGTKDIIGNLLRSGSPFGSTDNHGWPTFVGWPTFDTYTHQQVYWVWLERAWRAGLRLAVANTSEDAEQCRIEPMRAHSCNETASIRLQVRNLRRMQNYIDAQFGGPGRGFFRLVYGPAQARRVIDQGKLAVVIGVESSNPFGCSEYRGRSRCTRVDVNRGLKKWWRLGVRTFFPVHWVDNAFAGAALEGGTTGIFINILNRFQTGRYFRTSRCPHAGEGVAVHTLSPGVLKLLAAIFPAAKSIANEPMPTYPSGLRCNARGLTPLGRYLIRQMIARHFMIQVDHLSEKARDSVLRIAARTRYPLISPHTDTGGEWVPQDLRLLYAGGGLATITPDLAAVDNKKILRLRRYRSHKHYFGVAFGTDTGGFAALPGPRKDAAQSPLRYPFKSYAGPSFTRERTGEKVFDLNTDGVAQYGLFADLIGDMQHQPGGRAALPILFRSAEAYLEAWQRAAAHR
jgi:microsomal dipeptidase-like Zn-dependent dipeptidase